MMFSIPVQRLHELAWQPGRWMHEAWWHYLGLASWKNSYQHYKSCQPAIDQLIIYKRQFPQQPLPGDLDDNASILITLEPKLPRLIIALGLIALACQDYLLLGRYRRLLATSPLGAQGCDQLLALFPSWNSDPALLEEEQLLEETTRRGIQWLMRDMDYNVIQALMITFPPIMITNQEIPNPDNSVFPILTKLARFL